MWHHCMDDALLHLMAINKVKGFYLCETDLASWELKELIHLYAHMILTLGAAPL